MIMNFIITSYHVIESFNFTNDNLHHDTHLPRAEEKFNFPLLFLLLPLCFIISFSKIYCTIYCSGMTNMKSGNNEAFSQITFLIYMERFSNYGSYD